MSFNYLSEVWEKSLKKIIAEGNYREINSFQQLVKNNKNFIDFSSNDYLDLRNNKSIIDAGHRSALKNGAGSGSSRLVLELDQNISLLENYFSEKTEFRYSIFFPSGFVANAALFDALSLFQWEEQEKQNIHYFIDHRCHASLFYGLKNANVYSDFFRHNDYMHLEHKLLHSVAPVKIVVIESLYSVDGDFSDPQALLQLCEKYNLLIIIDETHTVGTYGKSRTWLQAYSFLKPYILASMSGCGKAIGVAGGFLATDHYQLKERIIQKSKLLINSTAVSPFVTGAVQKSLEIIYSSEGLNLITKLHENISYLRDRLAEFSENESEFNFDIFDFSKQRSNIFPLVYKYHWEIKQKEKYFIENGLILKALRPPTVPKGTSRFRVILKSSHSRNDIDMLVEFLKK
ncbi:pyridoxal phosphate-dependent aminotransferase family protein [Pigmentibacter sp. JX0631]|uniref:aminotransferase class I/II-fold pyridoxal phosphate-dependent enzyme n=1 Tax=Pigmentibacter sp. JX0631 TaxID=2976982 RepID=UPI00246912F6|nr:pyridoxal phosphate-dependent aminotransferase family protein [Pigmentibacter sp. JX0631]WGL60936.1 pyridoxal phosphate-dependent aminotransferase family protein [Pigmentibacter sp. JX0631]